MNTTSRTASKSSLKYTILTIIISLFIFFPLYWMISTSLKFETDIFTTPPSLYPERINVEPYLNQLANGDRNILQAFGNSLIIALGTMILSTLLSTTAAYGLARFHIKGRKGLIFLFLITQMLPAVFVLTPLFIIFKKLNIQYTYLSVIIADATIAIPFCVLVLRTYFLSVPKEVEESARIDGCNHFSAFLLIMLPIARSGVIVSAVFSFLFAWGDLIFGLTFINNQAMRPITASMFFHIGKYGTSWNHLMAFGVLSVLPVVLIFVFLQRYIISGLSSGAVKG